jgi:hypothetical protein
LSKVFLKAAAGRSRRRFHNMFTLPAPFREKEVDSITFCWYNKANEICAENGVALLGAPEGKSYG